MTPSFYGATVNVSVLPYAPYWEETVRETKDGRPWKTYSGTDYQLVFTMSTTLNFKINVLPASTWEEVRILLTTHTALQILLLFLVSVEEYHVT